MNEVIVPELETERLLLRHLTPDDLDEFGRRIFADPEVIRYLPRRDMTPRERAERAYRIFDENWSRHRYGGWLITDKLDGQPIGACDLDPEEPSEVELGYSLATAYWGKGLATEAARAAVRFGFENAGLERIVAVVVPENTASSRLLERIGFVHEKKARRHGFDVVYYALRRDQFQPGNEFYRVLMPKSAGN
jgi:ribosomal-protein-alanine N-acetyltransferase